MMSNNSASLSGITASLSSISTMLSTNLAPVSAISTRLSSISAQLSGLSSISAFEYRIKAPAVSLVVVHFGQDNNKENNIL